MSLKLNKRVIVFALIALLAVTAVIIIAVSAGTASPLPASSNTQTPISVQAATEQQRLQFIGQFGWTVSTDAPEFMVLYIPKEFDTVLTRYNAIQKRQGFDLEQYRGKKVDRYSYLITNYPAEATHVYINLIVYEGCVIGGDVCSKELGGFMHGFAPEHVTPKSSAEPTGTFIEPDFTQVDADVWPED